MPKIKVHIVKPEIVLPCDPQCKDPSSFPHVTKGDRASNSFSSNLQEELE